MKVQKRQYRWDLPFLIGVTGSIGSGKSTVARLFGRLGAVVVELDRVGHDILEDEDVKQKLVKSFGDDILSPDGHVDRKALADVAFSTLEAVSLLNTITHPKIEKKLREMVMIEAEKKTEFLVVESPLLMEAGNGDFFDVVVLVVADLTKRIQRVKERGWSEEELKRRERFFMDEEKKIQLADIVIDNDGSIEDLWE
ncbi:MAG: dephospho-CoA kinase, partial [Synergistetes bacterium]|nr:dephospho-CoA kinase [Synergistota bacterium]